MKMKDRIADRIESLISTNYRLRRIFVRMHEFKELYAELAPIYQEQYGGMVSDMEATKEGYHNILFKGVAVCLSKDPGE